ncbi:MAG: RNB domain-containing ribonuclease, partial [Fibrobacter sp.]|nr:RNB domain-containing ribonuclease [Fibrobacter sp.]
KNMFPRAFYTRNNKGHEGLGIDFYSHVTSPLRRLADNIADICIVKLLLGEYIYRRYGQSP